MSQKQATVGDVMAVLDKLAPPHLCIDKDPRGLLIGDRSAKVTKLVVALDVTPEVAEEAVRSGAQMIIAHHPLIYYPLKNILTDEPHPGGVVLTCIKADIAVACAHTNWDVAPGGINDTLCDLFGLVDTSPLQITYREPLVQMVVFVPVESRDVVLEAMASAGAGALGNYDRCAFMAPGTGTFRPLPGANPAIGTVGSSEYVNEERLEMIVPEGRWRAVLAAARAAHPYEEVAYGVYPLLNKAATYGIGRVGSLPAPVAPGDFLARVKDALSFSAVRMSGPRTRPIQKVAVCGGAGAFLVPDAIAANVDVLVTSDVRHHEFVDAAARDFLLMDAGHAATETPGTRELARQLETALTPLGVSVSFVEGVL